MGWDAKKNEKHTDALLRSMVLFVLGKLEDQEILDESNNRFEMHLKKKSIIKPDLREVVFSLAAWTGNNETYEKLIKLYHKASSQESKLRVLAGLC